MIEKASLQPQMLLNCGRMDGGTDGWRDGWTDKPHHSGHFKIKVIWEGIKFGNLHRLSRV